MPYIAAAAILCLVPVSQFGRMFRLAHGLSRKELVRGLGLALVTMLCGLATWLPVAATAFEGRLMSAGEGTFWRHGMQHLVLVAFVGALVACAAYSRTILHQLSVRHAPYVADGAAIICALSAAYVAFATADSHLFFSVERAEKVELRTSIDDSNRPRWADSAHCEYGAAFLLASLAEPARDSSFTIRCPRTIALGAGSTQPFLPWPSYDEMTLFLAGQ